MKIRHLEFEGSPAEFSAVRHLFGAEVAPQEASEKLTLDQPAPAAAELTSELAGRALTRLPLSISQRGALRAVVTAGDSGILSSDVAKAVGISRPQLAGVWGALGRRFSHTPGWPENAGLVRSIWDGAAGQYRHCATPPLIEAVKRGLVTL